MGVVGNDGAEAIWILCGVTETCEEAEGKHSEGRFVEEGGGGQSASGSGYTTAPYPPV